MRACAQGKLADLDAEGHHNGRELHPIPVKLTWTDISYRVLQAKAGGAGGEAQKHKTVVHPCSGAFLPREAIAIMGPSGAGGA